MATAFPPSAVGVIDRPHLHEQAARQQAARLRTRYESHEFDVPILTTNERLTGGVGDSVVDHGADCSCGRSDPAAFVLVDKVQHVNILNNSGITLTVRFNSTTDDPITVSPGDRLDWRSTEITEIFFTNGSGAVVIPVKVILA